MLAVFVPVDVRLLVAPLVGGVATLKVMAAPSGSVPLSAMTTGWSSRVVAVAGLTVGGLFSRSRTSMRRNTRPFSNAPNSAVMSIALSPLVASPAGSVASGGTPFQSLTWPSTTKFAANTMPLATKNRDRVRQTAARRARRAPKNATSPTSISRIGNVRNGIGRAGRARMMGLPLVVVTRSSLPAGLCATTARRRPAL